ncbi:MAG: hypothetical protein ACTHWH_16460, partial [Marinobacter sp.]
MKEAMNDTKWTLRRLSQSPPNASGTSHAYYDIPVINASGSRIVAHRLYCSERHPTVNDRVEIGLLDTATEASDSTDSWEPIGESRAWSWQQGPMSQWLGDTSQVVWNARNPDAHKDESPIMACIMDTHTGSTRQLPGQVYAVTPDGTTALSLDMTRLDRLRPGYGYAPGENAKELDKTPKNDGVWSMNIASGDRKLLLSLDRAVDFLNTQSTLKTRLKRMLKRYHFWFNHAKFSPDGSRFTVKLRWRNIGGPWSDRQGVSLTCGIDGSDLRLLAPTTSHVIWLNNHELYFWQRDGLRLAEDTSPCGTISEQLAPELIQANVHMRHFQSNPDLFVFDTPYREDIDLALWNRKTDKCQKIAEFQGHKPARGPFRCDLHPCLSRDGKSIVVTSLQTG